MTFIFLGVLAPTGAVLWFMNEAVRNEAKSDRQRVKEAYRDRLRLVRDLVDSSWKRRSAALDSSTAENYTSSFLNVLQASGADGAVLLDGRGLPAYPGMSVAPALDPIASRMDWTNAEHLEAHGQLAEASKVFERLALSEADSSIAARAAQSDIRCLMRAGKREEVIATIPRLFGTTRLARAHDLQGRLISADEALLLLQILKHGDRRTAAARRLALLLNNYRDSLLPSAQRLFLMDELHSHFQEAPPFPTYTAELLSQSFLEVRVARATPTGALEPSGIPGVWQLASPSRRVVALFRTETILAATNQLFQERNSSAVVFTLAPQGATDGTDIIPAGAMLPGWQISYSLHDPTSLAEAAHRRTYLWIGYLVILAIAMIGLMLLQSFRRQQRLTRLKTDLVAAVSHELKTPLASMQLLVETLLEENYFDQRRTREYLQLIAGENVRLSRLITNFLTFSRVERNTQQFTFAETRPDDIVQATISAMRERLQQTPACQLEVDISPNLPSLYADEDALVTMLLNLVDNAHKYTRTQKSILVRVHAENDHVILSVKDNGIGIAPREQKRIFQRFYQIDRRMSRETGGCGLGLSIVDFIVRAHGGSVKVESSPGMGSTFSVLIPHRSGVRQFHS